MTKKICFVICPIGQEGSDERKRSDQVLKHIIKPAIAPFGYKAERADKISEPGMITSQIIQHIVDDPLIIADLSGCNPNVFYELGIRHVLKTPYIQLMRQGETLPFDVAGARTIFYDHTDLDSVESTKIEIKNQIEALEKDQEEIESPVSMAIDLKNLKKSDNLEDRTLADILDLLSHLNRKVENIENATKSIPIKKNLNDLFNENRASVLAAKAPSLSQDEINLLEDITLYRPITQRQQNLLDALRGVENKPPKTKSRKKQKKQ